MTSSPLWTPNGKQLIFSSSRNNALRSLFRQAADGTGDIERLTTSPNQQSPWGWSKDGQTLVFLQLNSDTSYDILDGPISALDESRALMQTKEVELYPTVSPDGDLDGLLVRRPNLGERIRWSLNPASRSQPPEEQANPSGRGTGGHSSTGYSQA